MKIRRDDALAILKHFVKDAKRPGTATAAYHGFNAWSNFLVKATSATLEGAHMWEVPGLFISFDEIKNCTNKPYLTVLYQMGCGRVMVLVLPVVLLDNKVKIPNNFTVLKYGGMFAGEYGFWIGLDDWHDAGQVVPITKKR